MWPNPQETPDLVTFTAEILNGKLNFILSVKVVFEEVVKLALALKLAKIMKAISKFEKILKYLM